MLFVKNSLKSITLENCFFRRPWRLCDCFLKIMACVGDIKFPFSTVGSADLFEHLEGMEKLKITPKQLRQRSEAQRRLISLMQQPSAVVHHEVDEGINN